VAVAEEREIRRDLEGIREESLWRLLSRDSIAIACFLAITVHNCCCLLGLMGRNLVNF
jgi:hypothetical protein